MCQTILATSVAIKLSNSGFSNPKQKLTIEIWLVIYTVKIHLTFTGEVISLLQPNSLNNTKEVPG